MDIQVDESVENAFFSTDVDSSDIYVHGLGSNLCDVIHHSDTVSTLERYAGEIAASGVQVLIPLYRNYLITEFGGKIVCIAACAGMDSDRAVR